MSLEKIKNIIKAYDDGITLQGVSQLFKVSQHDLIIIIYSIKVERKSKNVL